MTELPTMPAAGWGRVGGRIGAVLAALVLTLAVVVLAPTVARADFGISSFTAEPQANPYTPDVTVAGAHPDLTTAFAINSTPPPPPFPPLPVFFQPDGALRTIKLDLPRGVVLNPQVATRCAPQKFAIDECPASSQVGLGAIKLSFAPSDPPLKLYNLAPNGSEPARIGIITGGALGAPFTQVTASVTPDGGYRIRTVSPEVYRGLPILAVSLTLWGVPGQHITPADSSDDRAFVTSPGRCDVNPETTLSIDSYEHPGVFDTRTYTVADRPTGCESLPFQGSIVARPDARTAGGPAGFNVDLLFPQTDDPNVRGTAHLKTASVLLPKGVSINPGLAHDLTACSDGAFARSSSSPARCPAGSKIGVIGIDTPLLDSPIPGDIYVAQPQAGNLFRLFLYARGPGVMIKLQGDVRPDPQTGQLLAVFDDNPELPFTRFHLHFAGGNHAVLAMPSTCGPKPTTAVFTPWSGQPGLPVGSVFQIYGDEAGSPCPDPQSFAPTFTAGTTIPDAGANTGLSLMFGRGDQDRTLGVLKMHLPAGLLGRLADFPQCAIADADANRCSDDSLVGGTFVSAGVGSSLLNLPGKVYLTAPVKEGDIAGLAIIVRAVAGPYDLGTVVVHTGIKVNPDTSLTVESDPLPTILQGIPLRIRQVIVNVDRPGFMLNPTDCSPKIIEGTLVSSDGVEAPVSSPFSVHGCAGLPYEPPFSAVAQAPSKDGGTAGLTVHLGGLAGQANTRQVQVVLPKQLGARLEGPIQSPCTEAQFQADECPDAARVGTASAKTPVLAQPLTGTVYFLQNASGGGLPRLAMRLKGQIQLPLVGDIELTKSGRIVTTFTGVPDVPIDSFDLSLPSGDHAALSGASVCTSKLVADIDLIAHSGKHLQRKVPLSVTGCPGQPAAARSVSATTHKPTNKHTHKQRTANRHRS